GNQILDIGYASMAGATKLLHGVLPYGHLVGVTHGDTYGVLMYAWYVPAALVAPVSDPYDVVDGALWTAAAAVIATGWALSSITGRRLTVAAAGVAAAWFAHPAVVRTGAGGANDVVLAAVVAVALASSGTTRRTAALTAGIWSKLVPLVLVPPQLAAAGREGSRRAVAGLAAVSAAALAILFAFGGSGGLHAMLHGLAFQNVRSSTHSLWVLTGLERVRPAAVAAACLMVVAATVVAARDRGLRDDLRRTAALWASLLIAVELAANYWSPSFMPWFYPLVLIALFSPRPGVD
ncbi:MAG: hypothetical protein ACJ76Z_07385, partial [Thermoleophilaceae bacterium]